MWKSVSFQQVFGPFPFRAQPVEKSVYSPAYRSVTAVAPYVTSMDVYRCFFSDSGEIVAITRQIDCDKSDGP